MAKSTPIRRTTGCVLEGTDGRLRAAVGPALPDAVQECYHAIANECLIGTCKQVLVVGNAKLDAFSHLALRDVLRSMAVAGVQDGFRMAVVAETANLIAVYDTAVVEAGRLGIDVRRFLTEEDAARWLQS